MGGKFRYCIFLLARYHHYSFHYSLVAIYAQHENTLSEDKKKNWPLPSSIDVQNIRAVRIVHAAHVDKGADDLRALGQPALHILFLAGRSGAAGAIDEILRAIVHQDPVVGPGVEAKAVARQFFHGDVGEEGEDGAGFPRAAVVDLVQGHGAVDVVGAGVGRVVEEAEGHDDRGRQLAVREGDVEVLVLGGVGGGVLRAHERVEGGVDPGEADGARGSVPVARVVEVLDVVGVFEAEPVGGGEDREVAEGGGAADHGFVAAEERHAVDVVGGEVECWGQAIKSRGYGLGVCLLEFSGLVASPGGAVCRTAFVWCQGVCTVILPFVYLDNLNI